MTSKKNAMLFDIVETWKPSPKFLCESMIERMVAEVGRSSHWRTYFVTMLSKFSEIHVSLNEES